MIRLVMVLLFCSMYCMMMPSLLYANDINLENNSQLDLDKFEVKAAVVDIESVLANSVAVLYIKQSMSVLNEQIQEELSSHKANLKDTESYLIEKHGTLAKEEFDKLAYDFNQKVSKAQKEIQAKNSALERAHAKAMAQIYEKIISVISDLSIKYGFNIVFPSTQVLFVKNSLNITHEVIYSLNKVLTQVEIDYKPSSSK